MSTIVFSFFFTFSDIVVVYVALQNDLFSHKVPMPQCFDGTKTIHVLILPRAYRTHGSGGRKFSFTCKKFVHRYDVWYDFLLL